MSVCSGRLIGPYVFESYLIILCDWLLKQLQQITSFSDHTLLFRQDDAPLRWSRAMRDWLQDTTNFPNRWVG